MKKIETVLGTRSQCIKASVVSCAISKGDDVTEVGSKINEFQLLIL